MSWGTCYSGSNNIYFDFPPIMSDGRNFSTFVPSSIVNDKIRKNNNLDSNFKYRRFLTKNATNLIKTNQVVACDECGPCLNGIDPKFTNKYLYKSLQDKNIPYGYEKSNLKSIYLSRNELNRRKGL